jgi:hypothetical protein
MGVETGLWDVIRLAIATMSAQVIREAWYGVTSIVVFPECRRRATEVNEATLHAVRDTEAVARLIYNDLRKTKTAGLGLLCMGLGLAAETVGLFLQNHEVQLVGMALMISGLIDMCLTSKEQKFTALPEQVQEFLSEKFPGFVDWMLS